MNTEHRTLYTNAHCAHTIIVYYMLLLLLLKYEQITMHAAYKM